MKVYFAGVPGGDQIQREQELYTRFQERWKRLVSFFYEDQARVTAEEMKKTYEDLLCRE
jgi:hypothetical protein